MADIEINDISSIGAIRDVEPYILPPEAWEIADNMRFTDNGAERVLGRTQVFGTPNVAPSFLFPVTNASQIFWIYCSLDEVHVYDGSSHIDITNLSFTGASNSREWNGTLLGGVPIINNGVDEPQFWDLNTGNVVADLTNWTTNDSARVLRAFGPYLMAFDVTRGGNRFPHLVKWSHPADPGTVPSSWDHTDPTKDAGEFDLPDTQAGIILDALPLSGQMFVYKESSTWRIVLIGGRFVFDAKSKWDTAGILAPRCVTLTGDGKRHVVATQDDIIVHNGQNAVSILNKRFKKYLFNQIDISNYLNCFMFTNPFRDEVWFCYPESGQVNPNKALIWNYSEGERGALSEVDVDFRHAATGNIETASDDTWASISGTWASSVGPWSVSNRRKVVLADTDDTKMFELDRGTTNDGVAFTGTLQRTGISVAGRTRSGKWIVDFKSRKQVNRLWLKATGGPINVRIGFQDRPNDAVRWNEAVSFDPSTSEYIDTVGSGSSISIELSAAVAFRVLGYKLEGDLIGEY